MGNEYAQALGQSLNLSNVKKVNFSDNRLNERGSYNIVKGINKNVQELDLSSNKIGHESIDHICKIIQLRQLDSNSFDLRVIKIEKASIDDKHVKTLIDSLLSI